MATTAAGTRSISIPIAGSGENLQANLYVPPDPTGLVMFAHGSGSSRHSPRNRMVATLLNQGSLATLLLDLLTEKEEQIDQQSGDLRFDLHLLGRRLVEAADWAAAESEISGLPLGMFGASTGAGAALIAATMRADTIRAIVSRGGRPDLAGNALRKVKAPTLLIVGGEDTEVIQMNQDALTRMRCLTRLEIIPGATHLFEESGALDRVAALARNWFQLYLTGGGR
jgi:dienelactone hydrolase